MRVAVDQGSFTALRADGAGGMLLFVGILLLIPGFISDLLALFLLAAQVWRVAGAALGTRMATARDGGGVVDLTPEQWHQVPDPSLPNRREDEQKHQAAHDSKKPSLDPGMFDQFSKKSMSMQTQTDTVLVPSLTLC